MLVTTVLLIFTPFIKVAVWHLVGLIVYSGRPTDRKPNLVKRVISSAVDFVLDN